MVLESCDVWLPNSILNPQIVFLILDEGELRIIRSGPIDIKHVGPWVILTLLSTEREVVLLAIIIQPNRKLIRVFLIT